MDVNRKIFFFYAFGFIFLSKFLSFTFEFSVGLFHKGSLPMKPLIQVSNYGHQRPGPLVIFQHVRLPKLYQRFLVYLSIFGLIVFLYYDHNQASRIQNYRTSESFKNVPDADTEEWLRYNGLEGISPGDSLLINIGSEQCFHIGRFYERCFSFYELRPQLNNEHLLVERRKIHKDLRGSFGQKVVWEIRVPLLRYFGP